MTSTPLDNLSFLLLHYMHTCACLYFLTCMSSSFSPLLLLSMWKERNLGRQEISIEDIARVAGVSHSTVSRALRNSSLISNEVRLRIQVLAQEMGYTPNAIARSLQNQQTNTIGLVVTSISDPFFADVMKGVEEVAKATDFSVVLSAAHNDPDQEMGIIETFHRRRVDGILVASSRISSFHGERLHSIQIPTVLINSQVDSQQKSLHWVAVDDQIGARLAVDHLLLLGHRSIGYIGTASRPKSNRYRLEGYYQSLAAASIPCQDSWVAIAPPGGEASHEEDVLVGQSLLPTMLAAGVTAVFCYNDMVAVGVLLACRARGISIPGSLSVVGFDDIAMTEYVTPPLTTVCQPKIQMGHLAMQMLLDLLHARPVYNRVLSPSLTLRSSTAPPQE